MQKTSLSGMFPDTTGGNKCGRLTRDEEDRLSKDDLAYLHSRSVVCNQVIYAKISGSFTTAEGTAVDVVDQPVVAYFKRSGFKPISDFIDSLPIEYEKPSSILKVTKKPSRCRVKADVVDSNLKSIYPLEE